MNHLKDFSDKCIFIDDSILLYAYSTHPLSEPCETLLHKIGMGECTGHTTLEVIDEFLYKSVIAEASRIKSTEVSSTARLIKKHSDLLSSLVHLYGPLEDILSLKNLTLLDTSKVKEIVGGMTMSYNLFPSDALSAACCKYYHIPHIASADKHFERVDFLKVWRP
jgi:predicted nucleic acid-binding protein